MKERYFIRRFILLVASVFIFQSIFCQENYLSGYIIKPNGDTLKGYINYQNWERNPRKIFFKENTTDKSIEYSPSGIKGFGVKDEIYMSAFVEMENSPFNTKDLDLNPELVIKKDTVFLQTMIQGIRSLSYYMDGKGRENFYIKQDSSYQLLIQKKYLKDQDGEKVIAENKKYIGQLTLYLQDCPSVQTKLQNTSYNKKSLENLYDLYYNCVKSKPEFQKKTEMLMIESGVLAGASSTTLKFSSDNFQYLVNAAFSRKINFSGGLFLNLILSRNLNRWAICNELLFSSYKVKGEYTEFVNENKYVTTSTSLGYSYLKINNMIRYMYPVGKFFLFLNAGMSNGFAIAETNYYSEFHKFYTSEWTEEGKALQDSRKHEEGFVVGLGARYRKFSFETRYENGNGMSDYNGLRSVTNRYYLLFGYKF